MVNASERSIDVLWIDFEGSEQHIRRLNPGQAYNQPTFLDHVWIVRDEASNDLVKEIVVLEPTEQSEAIYLSDEVDLGPTLVPTSTEPAQIKENRDGCGINEPPARLDFDPFYTKYCDAAGIAIIGSESVRDLALQQAWYIVMNMLAPRPDIQEDLVDFGVYFIVNSVDDDITDLPNAPFRKEEPGERFAAASTTTFYPLATNNEGNQLCWAGEEYFEGKFIAVHEFAHVIHGLGFERLDPEFDERLETLYESSIGIGRWRYTYAATDHREYWAEGVTFYLNASPQNYGTHPVNTRKELEEHDPALFELIDETFRGLNWTPTCP